MPTAEYASPSTRSPFLRPALYTAGAGIFLLLAFSGVMVYLNFCWLGNIPDGNSYPVGIVAVPLIFSGAAGVLLGLLFSVITLILGWRWKWIWFLAAFVLLFGLAPAVAGHLTAKYIIHAHHLWVET